MKKLAYAVLTATMAGGLALSAAAPASAAHCVEDGEPGFSYFGTERASEQRTSQGEQADGSSGASACRATGSPSERAPGQD